MSNYPNRTTRRILEIIKANPGLTTKEILDLLPPRVDRDRAWYCVVYLSMVHEIENRGGAGRHEDVRWHILEWEPTAFYLELASDLLKQLKNVPPRKQAKYMARELQQFNEDHGITS